MFVNAATKAQIDRITEIARLSQWSAWIIKPTDRPLKPDGSVLHDVLFNLVDDLDSTGTIWLVYRNVGHNEIGIKICRDGTVLSLPWLGPRYKECCVVVPQGSWHGQDTFSTN